MHRQQAVSRASSDPSIRPTVRRPFIHRHPRPRNAPPALSDTTSAAPARTPGTRPPGNPPLSAPGRTATNGRSRAEGTPGPRASVPASVPVDASRAPSPAGGPGTPRPEPSLSATRVAGRPAHRPPPTHAAWRRQPNRQTRQREQRPHPRPQPAPNSSAGRVPFACQNAPRILPEPSPISMSSRSSEPTSCTGYSAASNSSACRSAASAAAVATHRGVVGRWLRPPSAMTATSPARNSDQASSSARRLSRNVDRE